MKNQFIPYYKIYLKKTIQLVFLIFFSTQFSCKPKPSQMANQASGELPPPGTESFENVTPWSGIDFVRVIGDDHLSNLVESVGGGAAFFDFDQDGDMDLYVTDGNYNEEISMNKEHKPKRDSENKLYMNLGKGTFQDVTEKARVGDRGYGMGVTVGDFDNNGFPDLHISNHGANVLYRNNGNGTFTDVSKEAGIRGNDCSVGATWLDYDNDGFLDLYVGNYIEFDPKYNYYYAPDGFPGPMAYEGAADILYHNNGDGTFTDVTRDMGVFNKDGRAMGVGSADYDNDGWMDIFVSNDHMINYLYRNLEGKGFEEVGTISGVAFNQVGEATISMSVDFADYNNDGLLDLFVSDNAYCSLHLNQGNGVFTEMSYKAGIAVPSGQFVGWASTFLDYDNDGDLDLFKVNGELKHLYGQEDQLFENDGQGNFTDISVQRGTYFTEEHVGRGAAFGDVDNDGDLDAFIVNLEENSILLRNNTGDKKHWIALNLVGSESNHDAIGARVTVFAGTLKQYSQKRSASGYLSQNDPRLYFGLADHAKVDSIRIEWPSGKRSLIKNIESGQVLTVTEPE